MVESLIEVCLKTPESLYDAEHPLRPGISRYATILDQLDKNDGEAEAQHHKSNTRLERILMD